MTLATGTCYPDAWRYVMHHIEATLVHGSVVGPQGRLDHAWAELPDGTVWDPAAEGIIVKDRYYGLMDPIVDAFYTADEAALMLSIGQHGPWTAEERMEYIRR